MSQANDTALNSAIDLSSDITISQAQTVSVGTAAPPVSSETLSSETLSIPGKSGALPAQLWSAQGPSANTVPAIILMHDANGPDDWTHNTAARLAATGFTVVAPDFFANAPTPADDGAVARQDFLLALPDSKVVGDALAVVDWLVARGGENIGVIGCGWSGAYALMAAAHHPRVRAVVDIAGTISYPVSSPHQPGSPLNFVADLEGALFAAYPGADPQFPAIEIDRLRARLIEHDKIGDVKTYPDAPPGFWRDEASPQAQLLWRRVDAFLRDYLVESDDDLAFGEGYPNEDNRLHA